MKNKNKERNKNEIHQEKNLGHYIVIDSNNKLKEQNDDSFNLTFTNLANDTYAMENLGNEINKFFIKILPENKEADILKFNYSLSTKIRNKLALKNDQIKEKYVTYINNLIEMKIDPNSPFVLTSDINEKLAFVLAMFYKKIKKNGKFVNFDDVLEYISKLPLKQTSFLDTYNKKSDLNPISYIYSSDSFADDTDLYDTGKKTVSPFLNNVDFEQQRLSLAPRKTTNFEIGEPKNKSTERIPTELLILREKFENIKTIKFCLKKHDILSNELKTLDQNDIIYNIYVLTNLKLLFKNLFGIELDLSNEIILRDGIMDINNKFEKLLKKVKKNRKMTCYKTENKVRVYDVYKNKSLFSQGNKNINEDLESSDNFSIFGMREINVDDTKKQQERFLNKHIYSLQMIIIYWYFIARLSNLITFNIIIPINFEDNILLMFKESKIIVTDFNIFENLSGKISDVTLDFNSLDNKLFQKIIGFLFQNIQITKFNFSFFPPEEYFEPRHLFNLLIQCGKAKITKSEIKESEDIDVFLLRKLSEFFESNINKLFCYLEHMTNIKEISLIFDMPSILERISNYEMVIIKFFLNIFIYLNKMKCPLKKLTLLADNLNFDNRKYPFLSEFFETMNIYEYSKSQVESLTLKFRIYSLPNLYRIIPYNITHLSLGSFDLISFQYFVEYITSSEFSVHSQIKYLQITLSNSILFMDEICFNTLEKLFIEYPKNLEEICINTNLYASDEEIGKLLRNTNYNKIEKISFYLNLYNNENKLFKTPKKKNNNENSIENIMELYYIKKDDIYEKNKNKILNMMYKVGNKYNKNFMDFNIFSTMEKFLCNKGKKEIFIQQN